MTQVMNTHQKIFTENSWAIEATLDTHETSTSYIWEKPYRNKKIYIRNKKFVATQDCCRHFYSAIATTKMIVGLELFDQTMYEAYPCVLENFKNGFEYLRPTIYLS